MAKERSRSIFNASSPSTSASVARRPRCGGVCGSASENSPKTSDAAAATRIGTAVASRPSEPTARPATIQPIVPSTLMGGNSRPGSRICRNEMALLSASVGMKQSA